MKDKKVAESLYEVLADSYVLYVKTQGYHWNVTGPTFSELHKLFGSQYEEIAEAIDEIAERIRSVGFKVNAGLGSFLKEANISEGNSNYDYKKMLSDLISGNKQVILTIKKAMSVCQKAGDEGSFDMLVGRLQAHEKNIWMLESTI